MLLGKHRGWILRIPSLIKIEKQHSPSFLLIHIVDSTFHQTNYCSRLQTIRRSDYKPMGLLSRLKELRTFSCFPLSQHRGFYFPPAASKDRAVNSMEIKDFIILWTYSQWRQAIVVIPPFSPERERGCMLSFSWLSYSYVFVKWKKCNILPSFLLIHIMDSTFPHQPTKTGLSIVWKSKIS